MIIVSGTKRSGTSMWMQLLKAAGFQVLGDAFPGEWRETIADANPHGFYESALRSGIYYRTNPHPRTGFYLQPEATRDLAVKVFIPGLVRTDRAFIHRVVGTVRNWREYEGSVTRLYQIEKRSREVRGKPSERVRMPPVLEWWMENFLLVRDVATRRYPVHVVSYASVIESPQQTLEPILRWLGARDPAAAIAAVRPESQTQFAGTGAAEPEVEPEIARSFDALYLAVHSGEALSSSLLEELNETHEKLLSRLEGALAAIRADHVRRPRAPESAPPRRRRGTEAPG